MKSTVTIQFPVNPTIIGKIVGVYGVRGFVKVISFTDKMNNVFNYTPWFVWFKSKWKLLQVESWKLIRQYYIVKFIDLNNREFAMLFSKLNLVIDRSQLPSLCDNEYYWRDIIGCQVITITEMTLGFVYSIIETAAHDILVVNVNKNDITKIKNYLIPFVLNKIIKNINLITNTIIVDWDR